MRVLPPARWVDPVYRIEKGVLMGWLASFKGLKGVGVPPVIAAVALVVLFLIVRRSGDDEASSES